jgi:hypothetical protein
VGYGVIDGKRKLVVQDKRAKGVGSEPNSIVRYDLVEHMHVLLASPALNHESIEMRRHEKVMSFLYR